MSSLVSPDKCGSIKSVLIMSVSFLISVIPVTAGSLVTALLVNVLKKDMAKSPAPGEVLPSAAPNEAAAAKETKEPSQAPEMVPLFLLPLQLHLVRQTAAPHRARGISPYLSSVH